MSFLFHYFWLNMPSATVGGTENEDEWKPNDSGGGHEFNYVPRMNILCCPIIAEHFVAFFYSRFLRMLFSS